jgi:stearoyl-CoA desaturase (delta-9 desaturase)
MVNRRVQIIYKQNNQRFLAMLKTRPSYLCVFYSLSVFWKIYHLENFTRFHSGMLALLASYIVNFICPATYNLVSFIVPIYMCLHTALYENRPSITELLLFTAITPVFIGISMSICLHRYFSHKAFDTSRIVQFILGLLACFSFQGDPLWWAVMHHRHHKHCDTAGDPHSISHNTFLYSFIGWMMNPANYDLQVTDYDCLPQCFMVPELRVLARLHMLPPLATCLFVSIYFCNSTVLSVILMPMVLCRLITLLFNVEYHPTNSQTNTCNAVDNNRFLAQLVGESKHKDHHMHPRRAHRPDWDLPYLLVLRPLENINIIWNLK